MSGESGCIASRQWDIRSFVPGTGSKIVTSCKYRTNDVEMDAFDVEIDGFVTEKGQAIKPLGPFLSTNAWP